MIIANRTVNCTKTVSLISFDILIWSVTMMNYIMEEERANISWQFICNRMRPLILRRFLRICSHRIHPKKVIHDRWAHIGRTASIWINKNFSTQSPWHSRIAIRWVQAEGVSTTALAANATER